MQLKISQVRVGAFVLNKFILRNLLYWWRSSFMVIITRETFLPARSCPCATDVDAVIWTVGQQAGFAWFLDAVCTLSCYKIMFKIICWRSATHCVAFCSVFYLCRVQNSKSFMPFTKLARKKPTLFHSYSPMQFVYFCSVPVSLYSWYMLFLMYIKKSGKEISTLGISKSWFSVTFVFFHPSLEVLFREASIANGIYYWNYLFFIFPKRQKKLNLKYLKYRILNAKFSPGYFNGKTLKEYI